MRHVRTLLFGKISSKLEKLELKGIGYVRAEGHDDTKDIIEYVVDDRIFEISITEIGKKNKDKEMCEQSDHMSK